MAEGDLKGFIKLKEVLEYDVKGGVIEPGLVNTAQKV